LKQIIIKKNGYLPYTAHILNYNIINKKQQGQKLGYTSLDIINHFLMQNAVSSLSIILRFKIHLKGTIKTEE